MSEVPLSGRRVVVMGLGLHGGGVAMVRYLCGRGARVLATDLRDRQTLAPSLRALADLDVEYVLGEHRDQDFAGADLVIRNPAVPEDSPYLVAARAAGVPIEMEMGLFFAGFDRDRIVGVTGTRGKTTTATFIHHALAAAGRPAVLAGNMRISAVGLLDELKSESIVVLELSSWQLEGLVQHEVSPAWAVVTNVLEDHLDRYRDRDAYAEAKRTILAFQRHDDLAVLNRGNPYTVGFAASASGRVAWFSESDPVPGWDRARIAGEHNRANLAAASKVLSDLGLSDAEIASAVASFPGVAYRQEVIARRRGIVWVNDTTSTTPDATIAALHALAPPFVWIAGGSEKHLDFAALARLAVEKRGQLRAVVMLPGAASERLAASLPGLAVHSVATMDEAVRTADALARPGDTVLLSPACASFGLFLNEFDRGDQFNAQVRSLRGESPDRGQPAD